MGVQPLPLDRLGQRFSIRLHEPAGGYRDVVGYLKSPSSIINRHNVEVSFDPNQIAFWREIIERPTKAGKGAPLTLRIFELNQICDATWPALEKTEINGWLLRAANGVTNRANSVLPLQAALEKGQLTNFAENFTSAQNFYGSHNLPTIFHLALPTWNDLREKLIEMGGTEIIKAQTMVADLHELELKIPTEFEISESSEVSKEWLAVNASPGLEKIVTGCPANYLAIKSNGEIIATARIAKSGEWSSITRVYVNADYRGKGLGKLIVSAALKTSHEQGATKAVLQVEAANATAIGLYESLGFNFHHDYVYLEVK